MDKILKRSKYKDQEFQTFREFLFFCSDKAKYLLTLENYPPMYVDEEGEILGFKAVSSIEHEKLNVFRGCYIETPWMAPGQPVYMYNQKTSEFEENESMLIVEIKTK
jgi:hypothetical protein